MYRPRIIAVILVDGCHAVKTVRFRRRIEIGDPVNAVSILNSFRVDELVLLDIGATIAGRTIDPGLLKDIASEARMPFAVGGGIRSCAEIELLLSLGAEKVVISTAAIEKPEFLAQAVGTFGSSSITGCLDVGRDIFGRRTVRMRSGTRRATSSYREIAKLWESVGVGEIIVQSIERDGAMGGYDIPLLRELAECLSMPVVGLGGAGALDHMREAYSASEVSALASGSLFCFRDHRRGVLINYPSESELKSFSSLRVDCELINQCRPQ